MGKGKYLEFTEVDKKELLEIIINSRKDYFTDSEVMDFCDDRGLEYGEVFHFLSTVFAPHTCNGCKHIGFYSNMYPCNVCTRVSNRKDMYESE